MLFPVCPGKERATPHRVALKLAVTDSAVNRITNNASFIDALYILHIYLYCKKLASIERGSKVLL